MAAELEKEIPAAAELLEHVVGLNGSARSLGDAGFRSGHDNGRPCELLPDPAGNNARQGFVAVRQKKDQDSVIRIVLRLCQRAGLFHSLQSHILAAVVQRLELSRQDQGPVIVFLKEEGQGLHG